MNLNATPETVRAVSQVFKLVGFLDDRAANPDKARIAAWAEQVQRHRLTESDMLDAVQAFYDQPHEQAFGVGDLIAHGRAAKRNRLEREQDDERETRRVSLDEKSATDALLTVTADMIGRRIKNRTPRLAMAEEGLLACRGRVQSMEALREYFAARREAAGRLRSG